MVLFFFSPRLGLDLEVSVFSMNEIHWFNIANLQLLLLQYIWLIFCKKKSTHAFSNIIAIIFVLWLSYLIVILAVTVFYKYARPRTAAMIAKAWKIVCNFLDGNTFCLLTLTLHFLGLAQVSSTCSSTYGPSISNGDMGLGTAFQIAHETAHS